MIVNSYHCSGECSHFVHLADHKWARFTYLISHCLFFFFFKKIDMVVRLYPQKLLWKSAEVEVSNSKKLGNLHIVYTKLILHMYMHQIWFNLHWEVHLCFFLACWCLTVSTVHRFDSEHRINQSSIVNRADVSNIPARRKCRTLSGKWGKEF